MKAPAPELADIFRIHGPAYLESFGDSLSAGQKKIMRDIAVCRTAALGGYVRQCDHCGHQVIAYRSCRNRHCPKCQAAARAAWLERRSAELLPVEYFHVVFTLPQQIAPLALQNQRIVYSIVFRAASETLLEIAGDPKHLGADIGFLAVLHTWGQNLHHHPHLHCVVPGGGIDHCGFKWVSCRRRFLFPVKVLSRLLRGKFVAYLKNAFHHGKLSFHGRLGAMAEKQTFMAWLGRIAQSEWVVYAKPPFGGPQQVLKYLARYTHRVAISNQRLVSLQDGRVTFRWKDYSQKNQYRTMTLEVTEFIRRFLLHVVPRGFVKIRAFGFLANRCRREKILLCRKLLAIRQATTPPVSNSADGSVTKEQKSEPLPHCRCPLCKVGHMRPVKLLLPQAPALGQPSIPFPRVVIETDTS